MNVFSYDLGTYQGRMPVSDAPDGAYVYELGHAKLMDASVKVGDFHEVSQQLQLSGDARYIQASIVITTPLALPAAGLAWEVSAWLNDVKMVSRQLRRSRRRIQLDDWRISLAGANAPPALNTLKFRLELV